MTNLTTLSTSLEQDPPEVFAEKLRQLDLATLLSKEHLLGNAQPYLDLLTTVHTKTRDAFPATLFLSILQHRTPYQNKEQPWMSINRTVKEVIQDQYDNETDIDRKSDLKELLDKYEAFYREAIVSALSKLDHKRLSPELLASLINEKPLVKDYLLNLNKSESTQRLLGQCLDSTTTLHQFCAKKTGINPFGRAQLIVNIEKRLQEWAPKASQTSGHAQEQQLATQSSQIPGHAMNLCRTSGSGFKKSNHEPLVHRPTEASNYNLNDLL